MTGESVPVEAYPERAASDFDALTALVGGYAFVAAEQTIDELYMALGITEGSLLMQAMTTRMHERIG